MISEQFSVVKFLSDNTCEFVPSSWLITEEERTFVKFPNYLNTEANALRRNPASKPKETWPLWEVKIKKSYDSLEKAERKAEKYKDTSDIESSATERTLRSGANQQLTDLSLVLNIPPGNFSQQEVAHTRPSPADQPLTTSSSEGFRLEENSNTSDPINTGESNDYAQFVVTAYEGDPTLKLLLEEQRAFQEKSLENQAVILLNQLELKTLLVRALSTKPAEELGPQSMFDLIPLKSEEDLEKLEEYLQDRANQDRLTAALCRFGRTEMSKTVADILSYLFEVQFQQGVRYTAESQKVPFKNKRLCECVRESVHRNHPAYKLQDINTKVGAWLRGSKDRGGGRKQRNGQGKKNHQEASQASCGGSTEGDPSGETESSAASGSPSSEFADQQ